MAYSFEAMFPFIYGRKFAEIHTYLTVDGNEADGHSFSWVPALVLCRSTQSGAIG